MEGPGVPIPCCFDSVLAVKARVPHYMHDYWYPSWKGLACPFHVFFLLKPTLIGFFLLKPMSIGYYIYIILP